MHREAFTQRSFYTEKLLHTASFCTEKLLHTASFCIEKILQKAGMCTENLLQETLLQPFTHSKLCTKHVPVVLCYYKLERPSYFVLQESCKRQIINTTLYYKSACTKHVPVPFHAAFMQPPQCDSRLSAAKRNSITHAAAARSNLDAAIPLRSAVLHYKVTKHNTTMHNGSQIAAILQLQKRISTPKRKNDDFAARFKRNFKRKIIGAKIKKHFPKHLYTRLHAASTMRFTTLSCKTQCPITHAAATRSNLWQSHSQLRSADTKLQNTIPTMHNGSQIAAILQLQKSRISTPKRKNDDFEARFKRNFKRKIIGAKIKKEHFPKHFVHTSHAASTMRFTTLSCKTQSQLRMQLAARSNLDAAIPLRSANTELQNTIELCTTAHKLLRFCSSKTGSRRQSGKTTILKRVLKGILKGKSSMPNQKICCQSIIHTSHAAITMRFTTLSCKTQ